MIAGTARYVRNQAESAEDAEKTSEHDVEVRELKLHFYPSARGFKTKLKSSVVLTINIKYFALLLLHCCWSHPNIRIYEICVSKQTKTYTPQYV